MPRQERSRARMHKKKTLFVFIGVFLSAFLGLAGFVPAVFAGMQTFEKDYTYEAGEADSKLSCRTISLEQAKRLLLEELGTYLESRTEVKNFQLTKDQITSLTAGAVKTEIVSEAWDGRIYRLKARITADPDEVAKAVGALRNDEKKTKELAGIRKKADDALRQVEVLKKELASLKEKQDVAKMARYNGAVKELGAAEWQERGWRYMEENRIQEAAAAYSKAIELDPGDERAYNGRGMAYAIMGKRQQAIEDFKRAGAYGNLAGEYISAGNIAEAVKVLEEGLRKHPDDFLLHERLGDACFNMGDYEKAVAEYKITARRLHSGVLQEKIGHAYRKLGNCVEMEKSYRKALQSMDIVAIDLPENLADIKIGLCYYETRRYKEAVPYYLKALQAPANQHTYLAYYNLACIHALQKDADKAVSALRAAIKLNPECKNHARTDGDFAGIRKDPRFVKLID